MKYTYEDFDNYTLEESLEILKKETKAKKDRRRRFNCRY